MMLNVPGIMNDYNDYVQYFLGMYNINKLGFKALHLLFQILVLAFCEHLRFEQY